MAKELIALRPDVLVGNSTPATAALLRETEIIPIVFVGVSDPVGNRFVESIARPGGSTTDFTNFAPSMIGKWLEMLKQVAPGITRAAVIFNPKTAPSGGSFFLEPFEQLPPSFAITPIAARVENADEIASTVAKPSARARRRTRHYAGRLHDGTSPANHSSRRAVLIARDLSLPLSGCRRRLVVLRRR